MRKIINTLTIYYSLIIGLIFILSGCGEIKRIFRGNYAFKYIDNHKNRLDHICEYEKWKDTLLIYKTGKQFKSKIEDKKDYLIIKETDILVKSRPLAKVALDTTWPERILMKGAIYSTENTIKGLNQYLGQKYKGSFRYSSTSFALQTLTVPLKFRKALDDGTKYPNQVETTFNIGFAPTLKYTIYRFNPTRTIMGKSLNQGSINTGVLLNLGATDLDTTVTAPGIKSNRKAPLFTYGAFIMLGINNFNFGVSVGWDLVLGEGHSYWVYQNKKWIGLILAIDIIKP